MTFTNLQVCPRLFYRVFYDSPANAKIALGSGRHDVEFRAELALWRASHESPMRKVDSISLERPLVEIRNGEPCVTYKGTIEYSYRDDTCFP